MTVGIRPPTRIISWSQLVQESDPNWNREKQRPWIYQFSNARRFLARPDIYTAPADGSAPVAHGPAPYTTSPDPMINVGGVLELANPWEFPTSASGLLPGAVYLVTNNGLAIVPGLAYNPALPPLFLSSQAWMVLLAGAGGMPTSAPKAGSKQLWNSSGRVHVA